MKNEDDRGFSLSCCLLPRPTACRNGDAGTVGSDRHTLMLTSNNSFKNRLNLTIKEIDTIFANTKREGVGLNQTTREKRINSFVSLCKDVGLNVTPQRLAIYGALIGDETHPSPDAVFRRVRESHPTMSHATVYKTLDTFERHGIISRLTTLHETVRYDPITSHHHHIICVRCKKVMNLPYEKLKAIQIPAQVSRDNKVVGYSVHFNVLCSSCKESE
jgi:Fur family transcriptional regulator, peroxide stress response regulator